MKLASTIHRICNNCGYRYNISQIIAGILASGQSSLIIAITPKSQIYSQVTIFSSNNLVYRDAHVQDMKVHNIIPKVNIRTKELA
jgi:hypothetical protein